MEMEMTFTPPVTFPFCAFGSAMSQNANVMKARFKVNNTLYLGGTQQQ